VKKTKEAIAETTRKFDPQEPQPRILPPVDRVEDGWARAMAAQAEAVNMPKREEARLQAAASLGIQAHELAQHEPQPEKPSLLAELSTFAESPAGPSAETVEKIAQLRKTREEQRASLKAGLRRELAPSLLRASETCAAIQKLAKEYRPVLQKLRALPAQAFLDQLPQDDNSITLVTRLHEAIDTVITMFDNGPSHIEAQGQDLDATVEEITRPTLTEQNKQDILAERNALENLCEMPSQIENSLRAILGYRKTIERLIQEEAQRALDAVELPQVERTIEQEKAFSRAVGEDSPLLKRLRG